MMNPSKARAREGKRHGTPLDPHDGCQWSGLRCLAEQENSGKVIGGGAIKLRCKERSGRLGFGNRTPPCDILP
jgi:hypothetical protein